MAVSVVMPALEMAQETGKLLAWRKQEGEAVRKGEPLLEIETDKAVVEIEAPGDGVLAGVRAKEGAVVPVGQTIAWLVQPGEAVPAEQINAQTGRTHGSAPTSNPRVGPSVVGVGADPRVGPTEIRISPKARRLAQERGIELATIKGSGPGGEILASDIESAIANQTIATRAITNKSAIRNPQSAMSTAARLMAERTTQSWTTVPHFFLTREVDASALVAAHEKSAGATHTDRLVALAARALKKHPQMNASWVEGGVRPNADINVAIAIAVSDAVVTGVIHRADSAALNDIAARRRELTDRARAGRLQPPDIAGATFTISNLGMYHVDAFTAIIVPPQAAILAVGAIADRVVAVDGKPAIRPMVTLTLSCDHRVVDGARGAAFLNDLAEAIREPGTWL
ncbi:MAG TPA: dihydrolipoamide acetyltransferase family protein [Vicinamibacterales bacterium]|jgi:pyruvate dehydrogenase E2 component (dihydrolipoamide acetyltransferase)|nr:dihydrolipoamide acetyltransferase family protein [Vicinamibacterales bacterium]